MDAPSTLDWIELVLGFECNCGCKACPSGMGAAGGEAMSSREIAAWLRRGRERGATGVWFGGGEPTLHPNLGSALARARQLGYRRIRLQTNGLRFAYPEYAERLVERGLGEVSVPIFGAGEEEHDAFARGEGSFALLQRGLTNLRRLGVRLEADLLITAQNMAGLADSVQSLSAAGVVGFNFWLVSMHGIDAAEHQHRVPAMAELTPHLSRALAAADELGLDAATLHTPPCVLPEQHRAAYIHAGAWRLLVVTPGNDSFMAEESPMEGGVYVDACAGCSWRERCLGLRADYLQLHGPAGFEPIPRTDTPPDS